MWPHRQKPTRLLCPWDSLGKNTGVGCHFLLQCMKVKSLSRVWPFGNPLGYRLPGSPIHRIFPGKNTGVVCHFLLQGIFPAQESNLGLPHCRQNCLSSEPPGKLGHLVDQKYLKGSQIQWRNIMNLRATTHVLLSLLINLINYLLSP